MRRNLIILVLSLLHFFALAQIGFPEPGFVFEDSSVPEIHITIDQEYLDQILNPGNAQSNKEFVAAFKFNRNGEEQMVDSIGFRLRGNTSRSAAKKSFKVSFNTFDKKQKFHGLEKMNLNGEHNDPTLTRAKLAWDLFRLAEVPGARSNHVLLYINDSYYGVYLNVEHIDEEFLKTRFLNDPSGNLYKCLYPADLRFKGADPVLYKEEFWGRRAYDLKTNETQDKYDNLARFISILNNSSDEDFICKLEQVFELDSYIRVLAIDILSSNWDGYLNKNNFYLYHNPCTRKFTYLPYDVDNTFGIDWFGKDWCCTNMYNWHNNFSEYRPLMERILDNNELRDRLSYYTEQFIQDFFNSSELYSYLDSKRSLIKEFRLEDSYSNLDYSWDYDDFYNSYFSGVGHHAYIGLFDYCSKRINASKDQLIVNEVPTVLKSKEVSWHPDSIIIKGKLFQDQRSDNIQFYYRINQGSAMTSNIDLDSLGNFEVKYNVTQNGTLHYYFQVSDSNGLETRFPECDFFEEHLGYPSTPNIVINEIMSDNANAKADEFGEYEDWIELYNNESYPIKLSDFYLSDNINSPDKWSFGDVVLQPNSYYIVWCDDDEDQGINHTNFKLNKEGEFLGLFANKSDHFAILDSIFISVLSTDESFARMPNGMGEFITGDQHTFGTNNDFLSSIDKLTTIEELLFYPNPASAHINFISRTSNDVIIQLFDFKGRLIHEQNNFNPYPIPVDLDGIFILYFNLDGMTYYQKVIISH